MRSLVWTSRWTHLQIPAEVNLTSQQAACENTKPTPSAKPLPPPNSLFLLGFSLNQNIHRLCGRYLFALQINRTFSFSLGPLRRKNCVTRELFTSTPFEPVRSPQDDTAHTTTQALWSNGISTPPRSLTQPLLRQTRQPWLSLAPATSKQHNAGPRNTGTFTAQ